MIVKFYIQPGAKKTEYVGKFNDMPKIKIAAPPVEGAANKELINFLSKKLKIKKNLIKIKSGEHSRTKLIELESDYNNVNEILDKISK